MNAVRYRSISFGRSDDSAEQINVSRPSRRCRVKLTWPLGEVEKRSIWLDVTLRRVPVSDESSQVLSQNGTSRGMPQRATVADAGQHEV